MQSYLAIWYKAGFFLFCFLFVLNSGYQNGYYFMKKQTGQKKKARVIIRIIARRLAARSKLYKRYYGWIQMRHSLKMLLKVFPALTLSPWRCVGSMFALTLFNLCFFLFKLDGSETQSVNNPPLFGWFSFSCYRVPESTSINQDSLWAQEIK